MRPIRYLPPLAIIAAAILWSFDGLIRQNLSGVPAITIVFLEHLLGGLLFAPLLVRGWREIRNTNRASWLSVFWVSLFGGLLGTFFYTKALSYVGFIDLSVVVLLQKFQPVFAIGLAGLLLKEKITRSFLLYASIAMVGGYLLTFPDGLPHLDLDGDQAVASVLAIGAAFAWGSSTVMGKYALRSLSFPSVTALRMVVTTVLAVPLMLALEGPTIDVGAGDWKFVLAIVLSTGSVAVFIYYYGLQRVPASHATLYELFWPLSAVLLDWTIYGRILAPGQALGGAMLIGVSIALSRGISDRTSHLEPRN